MVRFCLVFFFALWRSRCNPICLLPKLAACLLATGLLLGPAHAGDFELCINGVNLKGQPCAGGSGGSGFGRVRPQQVVATCGDAMEIILNMDRIAAGVDGAGNAHFVGRYRGTRFQTIRDEFFSCTVSVNAKSFRCSSWMPDRL